VFEMQMVLTKFCVTGLSQGKGREVNKKITLTKMCKIIKNLL